LKDDILGACVEKISYHRVEGFFWVSFRGFFEDFILAR